MVRGVGGDCDTCMCVARDGVGGVRVSGWQDCVWALPIMEEPGKVGYVSLFWLRWCGCMRCWGKVGGRHGPGSGSVG